MQLVSRYVCSPLTAREYTEARHLKDDFFKRHFVARRRVVCGLLLQAAEGDIPFVFGVNQPVQ
jgi:hypothetical protein